MSPCARGCCWTPMGGVCARNRTCSCHWDERNGYAPTPREGSAHVHADPTARQAIRNVDNERRK